MFYNTAFMLLWLALYIIVYTIKTIVSEVTESNSTSVSSKTESNSYVKTEGTYTHLHQL